MPVYLSICIYLEGVTEKDEFESSGYHPHCILPPGRHMEHHSTLSSTSAAPLNADNCVKQHV